MSFVDNLVCIPQCHVSDSSSSVQMGFFADAGPLQIFVSQHLIPSHYRVEITDDAAFESEDNAPPIKAGAFVRVRIVGLKAEANQLVCTDELSHSSGSQHPHFPHMSLLAAVLPAAETLCSAAVLCGNHHRRLPWHYWRLIDLCSTAGVIAGCQGRSLWTAGCGYQCYLAVHKGVWPLPTWKGMRKAIGQVRSLR